MQHRLFALVACAVGLLAARTSHAAVTTGSWGTPVNGLRGRLSALADTVREGETLRLVLELEHCAPTKEAPTRVLNWTYHHQDLTFHFREGATGAGSALRIGYGGLPWLGTESDLRAVGSAPLADTLDLWPMDENHRPLPVGRYTLVSDYRPAGAEYLEADVRQSYADRLWEDSLQTGPLTITVLPTVRVETTLFTNGGICLERRSSTLLGGGRWRFTPGDSVAIRYIPRPGHRVGRKYVMTSVTTDGTEIWLTTGYGGRIFDDVPQALWSGTTGLSPDSFLRVQLTIYETAMPGGHLSSPESPDSTLYRELFTQTFDCRIDETRVCAP